MLFPSGSPKAQTETGIKLDVTIGLDGYCLYEQWMPVRVQLENTGTDLEGRVEAQVDNGLNQWNFSQPISLPAVSRKEITNFVYLQGIPGFITVSFIPEKGTATKTTQNLNCLQRGTNLAGVWAATPSVYNLLTTLTVSGSVTSVAELEMADMPTHPEGMGMLNMLIISDVDTGGLTETQRQVLAHWVENGGRLVVVGGPGWQKTSAGLASLLPIRLSGSVNLPDLNGLSWLSPQGEPLVADTIVAVGETDANALILASQNDIPLILRQKVGYGEVYFLAADPALAPLRNWAGLEQMYQFMFASQSDIPSWAKGFTSWPEASMAVSNVPGLGLPSIILICGFLALYTLALGPLNYLMLRKLKRRELAWFTIPILVVMFSGGAFVLGLGTRGTRSIVNHLAIVQVWPEREQARVHGLVGVFSPNRSLYTVQVKGNYLAHPMADSPLGSTQVWDMVQKDNELVIQDLRIDAGGIEGIVVEGQAQAPEFLSDVTLQFDSTGTIVKGEVRNNSTLTLQDAVILGPGQVQNIGTFSPGDSVNVQLRVSGSSLVNPNGNFPPYASYGYDNTMQDVFGISYVGSSDDQDLARRFNLLQAAMGYSGSRGGGIYVVGWADTSPLEVALSGKAFKAEHTAIYIIALNPKFQADNPSILTLPPVMFNWERLDTASYQDNSPYNSFFYTGTSQFRFRLNQPIPYQAVKSLTFHLTNYSMQGPHQLNLSLWDFTQNEWVLIDSTSWGDVNIPEPERFVGFGGEIRLQIENPNQTSVDVERADFTLVVEP